MMASQATTRDSFTLPTTLHSDGSNAAAPGPEKSPLEYFRKWTSSSRRVRNGAGNGGGGGGGGSAAPAAAAASGRWWKIHPFRGMVNDLRRRAPYYVSDWRDAWDYRVVPATVYMYFAK
jgi:hypothetical protein